MLANFKSLVYNFARIRIMGFYYAVAKGRQPGIYHTWDDCKKQVYKFSGPVYKKFPSSKEAQDFIDSHSCQSENSDLSNFKRFVHTQSLPPDNLVALGKNKSSDRRNKRALDSKETNTEGRAKKRVKVATSNNDLSSVAHKNDNKNHFNMDPDGFVNVYTDGACSGNGYSGAKAGIGVYFGENSPYNVSAPIVGRATNNRAEIQAVTKAAEIASAAGMTKLRVHTDSEFLIKSVTQWMPGWKNRGWNTASGNPVVNKVEFQEMESALKPLQVEWNHVRGHRGIHGNEMADKLARQGAERYRSS